MAKRSELMRVDSDFKRLVKKLSEQNKISIVEASREIAQTMNLLNGKKKLKKRIVEEVTF